MGASRLFNIFGSSSAKDSDEKEEDVKKEPVSDDVKAEIKEPKSAPQTLDLVFTMDCTASMGSYIHAAKQSIQSIVSRLTQQEGADLRFGLVAYRDHPPQDRSFITKTFDFTTTLEEMERNLDTLSAQGGGDGPEAVAAALKATLDMDWRLEATKVVILIADAPPHGLGEQGDGFPDGSPDGVDPLFVLDGMAQHNICVYAVGCEPALGNYMFAREFMIACAERTNGQAIALGSAAALADVIMGGAIEEMDMEQLMTQVQAEVQQAQRESSSLTEEAVQERVFRSMASKGCRTRQMKHTPKLSSAYAERVSKAATLADARAELASAAPEIISKRNESVPLSAFMGSARPRAVSRRRMSRSAECEAMPSLSMDVAAPPPMMAMAAGAGAPSPVMAEEVSYSDYSVAEDTISMEQVSRMYARGKTRGMWH